MRSHDLLETITFNEQFFFAFLSSPVIVLLDVDNGTMNARDTLRSMLGTGNIDKFNEMKTHFDDNTRE